MSKSKKDTSTWLRYIVNIWTLVLFAGIGLNFFYDDMLERALGPICAIYIGVLVIYSAEKEFERWSDYYQGRHPGEIYVVAWTFILVLLSLAGLLFHHEYKVPSEVLATYIAVLSILAITKKSKSFYRENKTKKIKK